jgi:hypothetical protein
MSWQGNARVGSTVIVDDLTFDSYIRHKTFDRAGVLQLESR